MTALPMNSADALKIIATAQFRPFTKSDWMGFAGCESENPMIAEIGDMCVIIDGDKLTFNQYSNEADEPEWANFTLNFDDLA